MSIDVRPRAGSAQRSAGRDDLRPLGGPAVGRGGQRMLGRRGDVPRELAVLDPGGVEHLGLADPVGEDDPLAMPVETRDRRTAARAACLRGAAAAVPSRIRPSMKPWRTAENLTNPPLQTAS